MPSLSAHQSNDFVKLLLLGDAKSGKTGSLVSLVKAGYKLRILDFDNLLDILKFFLEKEGDPALLEQVEFRSLRDKRKATPLGSVVDGQAKAFVEGMKMLDHWKYTDDDGTAVDLGKPKDWGPDTILVLDSLSRFCDAAYDWAEPLIPAGKSGEKDLRAAYGMAQDAVENTLALLTSPNFHTNVIVICHGTYIELPDKTTKIFPQGVGQKLSPKIPQYFPNYIRYKNINGKRIISLKSDPMIDLANTKPYAMPETLPIETGLAEFFGHLRQHPSQRRKA
jgi:hypothetical protein